MRILGGFFAMVLSLLPGVIAAQQLLPEHRYLLSRDTDFYGADLTNLFDTTEEACARACSAQEACVAYTFNGRSNACFPKSAISDRQPYQGAVSASKVRTEASLQDTARIRRDELSFLTPQDIDAAAVLVEQNARRFSFDRETLEALTTAMRASEQEGNLANALRWAGKAVALSDRPDLWTSYSRFARLLSLEARGGERRRFRRQAVEAAVNATLRSSEPGQHVEALRALALALEQTNRGRDMIPVLRLAYSVQPRDEISGALDDAIGKYGFRIVEHRVDNNSAAPRICAEFSEKLVPAGIDYEPFVRVEGRGLVVEAQDKQLCIDGVAHGQRYTVTFRSGLPAADGETLHRDVTLRLYVRDRAPSVRFPGRAYVLPRTADAALPVETVNTDTLDLKLYRISDRNLVRSLRENYFGRPLSTYETDRLVADLAQEVWSGEGTVENELNIDMTARLPMAKALAGQSPGVYVLSASVPGEDPYDVPAAQQWFVVSDLGLSTWTGVDGLHAAVRNLGTAAGVEGATVSLVNRANAVLATAQTDDEGFVSFPAGLTRGTGANAPAMVTVENGSDDFTFLPLTDPAFDLSDRGVEGRAPAPPIDVFLSADRGAYRVGEVIHATALARDQQTQAIADLPITASLKRPDGVEYSRKLSDNAVAGGHVFAMELGDDVPRGVWRLDILSDLNAPPLASQVVLVEDFLPERIDFEVEMPQASPRLGETFAATITARYLFGAPGADLQVRGELRLRIADALEGWEGYRFGQYDSAFRPITRPLDPSTTDREGRAIVPAELPRLDEVPGAPLIAEMVVRVAEGSGRPVERRASTMVRPDQAMIGIKPAFSGVLDRGAEASFDVVAVSPDGNATPMPVRWTVNRVERRYQWYQLYGNWAWEPVTRRIQIATGDTDLGEAPLRVSAPTEWGSYELIVERRGAPFALSSIQFDAGWFGGDGATDTPDNLQMTLNSDRYTVGDAATLTIPASQDGVALVSVLSNRVVERHVVPVRKGETAFSLDVTPEWGSSAYVTASLLSAGDPQAGLNPTRQLGVVHASVEPGEKSLDLTITAPEVVDGQDGRFAATVSVSGLMPDDKGYVSLAAVDQGILNLTGFEAPDPTDHYFGQRRLGVELRDLYGRLIDTHNGAMGRVRSGGDAAGRIAMQSPPPTEKLMAFFAGPVEVSPDGTAVIEIEKPAFNGTIKLMAVAWSETGVGNASFDVVAKDPIVATASLARHLAPGDTSRLLLELVHASGPSGEVEVAIFADAGLAVEDVPDRVDLSDQASARLNIPVTAREIGDHQITIVLKTPDGQNLRKVVTLPVRNNDAELSTTRQFSLAPGAQFTFDRNVFAGLQLGTGTATLSAGPLARLDVPGLLRQLDRYPYGCTEQITSGAMPLLYLSTLAQSAGLGASGDIEEKIEKAIARVLTRQSSNGAFGLWRAQSGEFWLDAYVTDFLSRARAQGFDVPDLAFALAMDNLRNRVNYAPDFDDGGEDIAYALLTLAREGAASMGDLRYYADTKSENFATPLSVAQLGAALATYGDPVRADALFRQSGRMLTQQRDTQRWRSDFGTSRRDTAAVLKLSAETGSTAIDQVALATSLGQSTARLSTQEAAQVTLAAHALASPDASTAVRVDGQDVQGPIVKVLSDRSAEASVIENITRSPIDVTMTTYGVPEVAPPEGGYGYKLTRRYFDMEGAAIDGTFAAGQRFVAVLEVTPFEDVGARLIIDDPLPGGFEIDNPNLIQSGDIGALAWLQPVSPETVEFRADRFVAAVDHTGSESFQLAYVLRAVTPGQYHHPAATVEDMYRPAYRANTSSGRVTVSP